VHSLFVPHARHRRSTSGLFAELQAARYKLSALFVSQEGWSGM
jgi:hypothetical protein